MEKLSSQESGIFRSLIYFSEATSADYFVSRQLVQSQAHLSAYRSINEQLTYNAQALLQNRQAAVRVRGGEVSALDPPRREGHRLHPRRLKEAPRAGSVQG